MNDKTLELIKWIALGVIGIFGWIQTYKAYRKGKLDEAKESSVGETALKKLEDKINRLDDDCAKRHEAINKRFDDFFHDFITMWNKK